MLNTGRVRDHWHTMTRTGQVRAPVGARRRALRRDQHRRCTALRGARRVAGDAAFGLGIDGGARAHRRRRAGRHGVRADPLEPRLRVRRARRRAGQPRGRSHFGRARVQAHAGVHRAFRGRLVWRAADAQSAAAAADARGGRASPASNSCATSSPAAIRGLVARGAPLVRRRPMQDARYRLDRIPRSRAARVSRAPGSSTIGCRVVSTSTPTPSLPERAWLASLFAAPKLDAAARGSLLAGRAVEGSDQGALVCSCFGVGRNSDRRLRAGAGRPRPRRRRSASGSSAARTAAPAWGRSRPSSGHARRAWQTDCRFAGVGGRHLK